MGFDGGFETVDLDGDLDPTNRLFQSVDIDDRSNLLVVGQPSRNLLVEPILRPFPDSDDCGPDCVERAGKLPLIIWKSSARRR